MNASSAGKPIRRNLGCVIDFREYLTPAENGEFFLARQVSGGLYQTRFCGSAAGCDAFIASAQGLARRNAVRAYLLFLQGEPIRLSLLPVREAVVAYDYLGYDPSHASLSPAPFCSSRARSALRRTAVCGL